MRVAAAHWRIVLDEVKAGPSFRQVRWMALRAARASYLVHELPEGYALVVELARAAGFVGWRRAVASCAYALGHEAGWTWQRHEPWFPVDVAADARRRPASLRTPAGLRPIEVLGALAGGLGRRERGWRVRFDTGIEATLVREPGGIWYSDEPVERTPSRPPATPSPPARTKSLTGGPADYCAPPTRKDGVPPSRTSGGVPRSSLGEVVDNSSSATTTP